jgi:site-specific recombinase XerD
MTTQALTTHTGGDLLTGDLLAGFGAFLRLHVADGDASPHTVRSYHTNARQYVGWCDGLGIDPAHATENDLLLYRQELTGHYGRDVVAVKLAAVRRLYEAATWHGLRPDNPAAGLRAPKDKTERSERIKHLCLEGLRRLLDAPKGNRPGAVRDRAMLALMGRHGLRVSEVAGLTLDRVDLDAGTVRVLGKGSKQRTIYLTETTTAAIRAWLEVRAGVANGGEQTLFVALDRRTRGGGMTARAIRWTVDKYLTWLGLKADGISCHALRHSAATWARAGGAKIDALADMLGHSSTDTTRVYARIVDRMTENPARYLEALLA